MTTLGLALHFGHGTSMVRLGAVTGRVIPAYQSAVLSQFCLNTNRRKRYVTRMGRTRRDVQELLAELARQQLELDRLKRRAAELLKHLNTTERRKANLPAPIERRRQRQ